ncbi:MAG: LysR family transcriptional regulator [Pseudomonadota bacterium]
MQHLNTEHLRTFLAIIDAGSVTGGATRIGRSQSATSLQIKQLEETVGQALFRRHGRGVVLTAAGETLRPVALQVTRTLDRTLGALRGDDLEGRLRIGMPDDHSRVALTRIIAEFAALHPRVELEIYCGLGTGFQAALASGALDLAVHEVPYPARAQDILREDRLIWMARADHDFDSVEALPVAVFDRSCWWRDVALGGLDDAGVDHRVVFSGESMAGIMAAIRAGIAAGLVSAHDDLDGLVQVPGLPEPHRTCLVLEQRPGEASLVRNAMCTAIRRAFAV